MDTTGPRLVSYERKEAPATTSLRHGEAIALAYRLQPGGKVTWGMGMMRWSAGSHLSYDAHERSDSRRPARWRGAVLVLLLLMTLGAIVLLNVASAITSGQ
jgi:hypothetical protein